MNEVLPLISTPPIIQAGGPSWEHTTPHFSILRELKNRGHGIHHSVRTSLTLPPAHAPDPERGLGPEGLPPPHPFSLLARVVLRVKDRIRGKSRKLGARPRKESTPPTLLKQQQDALCQRFLESARKCRHLSTIQHGNPKIYYQGNRNDQCMFQCFVKVLLNITYSTNVHTEAAFLKALAIRKDSRDTKDSKL